MNGFQEKEHLYQFHMGMDVEFHVIKTQILTTKPTPTLGSVYHPVVEDKKQRCVSNDKRIQPAIVAFKAF